MSDCIAGDRCSCGLDESARAKCSLFIEGDAKPTKVYGIMIMQPSQKPLIDKHCFGDCGKISMAGGIDDAMVGPLMVCCEHVCPVPHKQMGEPFGTTMSFGRPHEVYLRALTGDKP